MRTGPDVGAQPGFKNEAPIGEVHCLPHARVIQVLSHAWSMLLKAIPRRNRRVFSFDVLFGSRLSSDLTQEQVDSHYRSL